MTSVIPRGIIYRNLSDEFLNLFKSIFFSLEDTNEVESFEKVFANYNTSKYCVAFPFARTAFYSILKLQHLKEGDEVILPPIQIKPMLEVVLNLKLKPVIVDIDPKTLSFDLKILKKKINSKTKAILLTYLYGIVPNINKIKKILGKKVLIIEDFSQCLNGKFNKKKVGNFGDFGIYSGSATKTLDTYGGGFVFTNKVSEFDKLKKEQKSYSRFDRFFLIKKILLSTLRNILTRKIIFSLITYNLIKIIKFIIPDFGKTYLGARSLILKTDSLPKIWFTRFTSIQANYAKKKIKEIDKEDRQRIKNCKKIINSINKKNFFNIVTNNQNVYWQLICFSNKKKTILNLFEKNKIDTATPSIILYSNIKKKKFKIKVPNAELIYNNSLFIPSYHRLKDLEINRIIGVLKNA